MLVLLPVVERTLSLLVEWYKIPARTGFTGSVVVVLLVLLGGLSDFPSFPQRALFFPPAFVFSSLPCFLCNRLRQWNWVREQWLVSDWLFITILILPHAARKTQLLPLGMLYNVIHSALSDLTYVPWLIIDCQVHRSWHHSRRSTVPFSPSPPIFESQSNWAVSETKQIWSGGNTGSTHGFLAYVGYAPLSCLWNIVKRNNMMDSSFTR